MKNEAMQKTTAKKKERNLTRDTLQLRNPIKIDGKDVAEVTYDSNEINGILFATAEAKRKAAAGMNNVSISLSAEFDTGLHLYLGFAAIVAVNPTYDFSDVERIKGRDMVDVMAIGRNFMLASEKEQQENDSGAPTETTPESTTQAPQSSKESE
jgi:hypothetical protein